MRSACAGMFAVTQRKASWATGHALLAQGPADDVEDVARLGANRARRRAHARRRSGSGRRRAPAGHASGRGRPTAAARPARSCRRRPGGTHKAGRSGASAADRSIAPRARSPSRPRRRLRGDRPSLRRSAAADPRAGRRGRRPRARTPRLKGMPSTRIASSVSRRRATSRCAEDWIASALQPRAASALAIASTCWGLATINPASPAEKPAARKAATDSASSPTSE